ncbi:hypothetical protein [Zhongshania sp.]|uniref:hypothetical protein n=1 Tax=Zhongshania sp. TaxID=1971902 RepID=UPI001B445723|nr:hypothetical protein [Zhongshania sp.]MBQ0797357.1 hypothetical protein [Zhongshania sp.]
MPLSSLQTYDIEKALVAGRKLDAIKMYREATGCSLVEAKDEIENILTSLKSLKPRYFKDVGVQAEPEPVKPTSKKKAFLMTFFLVDTLIFAGLVYYFVFRDDGNNTAANVANQAAQVTQQNTKQAEPQTQGRPKSISLPGNVDTASYTESLSADDSFDSLYQAKLNSSSYINRKSSGNSSSFDSSEIERKIKTARSLLAQQRVPPTNSSPTKIAVSNTPVSLDGIINSEEWHDATAIVLDAENQTTLYFKTDGEWLYIACDAPIEKSQGGYDQLRVYFHAGLSPNLVNERIHIGKGAGVTSIRQTTFRWQGDPPKNDNERWKKYAINDWGLYNYAYGSSSMSSGHRQYEAAIHLGEAGLHSNVPFTVYAEVETDPLKDEKGKFVERQYLGELGNEQNPVWMVF